MNPQKGIYKKKHPLPWTVYRNIDNPSLLAVVKSAVHFKNGVSLVHWMNIAELTTLIQEEDGTIVRRDCLDVLDDFYDNFEPLPTHTITSQYCNKPRS